MTSFQLFHIGTHVSGSLGLRDSKYFIPNAIAKPIIIGIKSDFISLSFLFNIIDNLSAPLGFKSDGIFFSRLLESSTDTLATLCNSLALSDSFFVC